MALSIRRRLPASARIFSGVLEMMKITQALHDPASHPIADYPSFEHAMNDVDKSKLEEACKLLNRVNASLQRIYGEALQMLVTGQISAVEKDQQRVPLDDLRTIVEIYFPELKNQLEAVRATKERFGTLYADVIIAKGIDQSARCPSKEILIGAYTNADRACDDFLSKAYAIARPG